MAGPFKLRFAPAAAEVLKDLESAAQYTAKLRKVRKALGLIQQDPRYPGLNSHKYVSLHGADGQDVWDSYVEDNTPAAWRIFWQLWAGGRHDHRARDWTAPLTLGVSEPPR